MTDPSHLVQGQLDTLEHQQTAKQAPEVEVLSPFACCLRAHACHQKLGAGNGKKPLFKSAIPQVLLHRNVGQATKVNVRWNVRWSHIYQLRL